MKIWLITISAIIPKIEEGNKNRTSWLAEKLIQRGHDILWWNSAFSHQTRRFRDNLENEVTISHHYSMRFLYGIGYRKNVSIRRYIDHLILGWRFKNEAPLCEKPDVIVVSMPDHHLAYEAVAYAKKYNIPVIVDVRDPWPDSFVDRFKSPLLRKLCNLSLWRDKIKLRHLFKKADAIVSISSDLLQWALEKTDNSHTVNSNVFYLATTKKQELGETSIDFINQKIKLQPPNAFNVFFVGAFNNTFDPVLLVHASRLIKERYPSLKINFIIAGSGEKKNEVEQLTKEMDNIYLPGWLNSDQIAFFAQMSHIAIIPSNNNVFTFPNKAFSMIANSLPIINTVKGELENIIQARNIGVNIRPGDIEEIVKAVIYLHDNPTLVKEMQHNVLQFYNEFANPDVVYNAYADYVEKIASR